MITTRTVFESCFVVLFLGVAAASGQSADPDWDIATPRGETRHIEFETEEGTWMSVDISPDGDWIVFDLLGHIYKVSADGGDAVALTQDSGIAMNVQPRISPDGREIAFVSDRGGQENLWLMNADGSNPRLVHGDMAARVAEPVWSPDGGSIVVTKREESPSGFYRTHDVLWRFPREGGVGSELLRLGATAGAAPARAGVWSGLDRAQWASFTPDGRTVYFHSSAFPGNDRRLRRLDLETGRIDDVTESTTRYQSCCGRPAYPLRLGEVAPEVSPDGRRLAFARKLPGGRTSFRGKEYVGRTALWLRDLETGDERIIMDPITNSLMEHHPSWHTRTLPGYSWARDGESIVLSQGGKIRRLWVGTGEVETIPFRATVERTISEQVRGSVSIDDDTFTVRALRWPASSPDGSREVFEAVGRLWVMDASGTAPEPLTDEMEAFQMTPAWSPDGRWVAFATGEDGVGGHIWKVEADGGRAERITREAGTYLHPHWTADGRSIVASRWPPSLTPDLDSPQWQLVLMSADDGAVASLSDPGFPARTDLGPDGRLYFGAGDTLKSVTVEGGDLREEARIPARAFWAVPSPAGRSIALGYEADVYVAPLPDREEGDDLPVVDVAATGTRLSMDGGFYPVWRDDDTLVFVGPKTYHVHHVDTGQTEKKDVVLTLDRDTVSGTIALTGGRIITLDERRVVEQGTVVARDGRITCVGRCDTSGADEVIDVTGMTIMPGWVDAHAHFLPNDGGTGIIPQHRATSAAYLAWGVTTTHDPSAASIHSYTIGEMVEAGRMVGPRSYGSPAITCGAWSPWRDIGSFDDAQHIVTWLTDLGVISIKDYKQCTRLQRTWLAEAARRRGVTLTSEGSDLDYLVGLVMTGHAGWEHPVQYLPIYGDVTRFFGSAGAHYSGQLMISDYPVGNAIEYWFGQEDLWQNDKVLRWNPWREVATRRIFVDKPKREYLFPILAEAAADIKRAGGYAVMGAHGEQDGLGSHWEVWTFAEALTPMEALEAASLDPAHFLGLEHEIGSIRVGKLADLAVLDSNPLDDIRNTTDLRYVMKAGRLYEAGTLDEIWPRQKPYGVRPWVQEDAIRIDLRPDDYWDR
jgi:Tol biopolymer transport system component